MSKRIWQISHFFGPPFQLFYLFLLQRIIFQFHLHWGLVCKHFGFTKVHRQKRRKKTKKSSARLWLQGTFGNQKERLKPKEYFV